jgi:hypothetical protein
MQMQPRLSFVTLGVINLARATAFYRDVLGLPQKPTSTDISFFELGKTWLALYPRELLAQDANVAAEGSGFRGFTLAHNVRTREEVDSLLAHVASHGGRIVKPARDADWGGYSGYFADPDGFLWEVAWNPHFPHVD